MVDLSRRIRRNTLLLAATLAVNSAVLQLVAAISSLTFVLVTGVRGLLGLGPAIFLTSSGLTAVFAGRTMDKRGRIPVIACGYVLGAIGASITALATHTRSTPLVIAGFVLIGAATGISQLVRAAAGDMYRPERRARGISYVLFGSVFGAILGPTVFSPLFADRKVDASVLTVPWLAATGMSLVAASIVVFVRPDPRRIAELIAPPRASDAGPQPPAAPLAEIVRRPGVLPAMLAALASQGVMVSVMNLAGYIVVVEHHHAQRSIFPIIAAHVLGMYALVLVVGTLVDRIGRAPALVSGLVVLGISALGLQWFSSVPTTAILLFGLGIGWNISYVAAAAQLADLTHAHERGRLFGFNDLLGAVLGAALALGGGLALETVGVGGLAIGAAVIAGSPIVWILRRSAPPPPLGAAS